MSSWTNVSTLPSSVVVFLRVPTSCFFPGRCSSLVDPHTNAVGCVIWAYPSLVVFRTRDKVGRAYFSGRLPSLSPAPDCPLFYAVQDLPEPALDAWVIFSPSFVLALQLLPRSQLGR